MASPFPALLETIVYREFVSLRGRGVRLVAATVHPAAPVLGVPRVEALKHEAIAIYRGGVRCLVSDMTAELLAHPMHRLRTIVVVLADACFTGDLPAGAVAAGAPGEVFRMRGYVQVLT